MNGRVNNGGALAIALVVLLLIGCAGLGPTLQPDWQKHISAVLPTEDGPLQFSSAAEWFPDAQGFTRERSFVLGVADFRQGVFALTLKSVLFMSWDKPSNHYNIMYRSVYTDIQSSRVDTFGRGRRIVITGKDYRMQSFDLIGPNGAMVDQEATQKAADMLAALVPKTRPE
jgi:hypothetical protein